MRPPLQVRVRGPQRSRLQKLFSETTCPRTQLHIQMVLLSTEGYAVNEIATITHKSDDAVRYWLHRFQAEGCAGLSEAPHSGRPPAITPAMEAFLRECIAHAPRKFRFKRPTWNTALLAKLIQRRFKLRVSDECIRQHLAHADVVCRRPTWTVKHLAVQQPGYAQKKAQFPVY
jgi:transposase